MATKRSGLIGYDATPLEVARSGVGRYTAQLLAALAARGDGREYALLASRRLNGAVPPGTRGQLGARLSNRSLWMQAVAPAALARMGADLCHFTNSIAPLLTPCPLVVTVHDMSLFLHADMHPLKSRMLVRTLIPLVARRARAIIAPSYSARRDIISVLGISPEKVHAIYEAPAREHRMLDAGDERDCAALERVRARYGLHGPYVLYVGTIEPRKNLLGLVRAFARLRRAGHREQLLLVGQLGWQYEPLLCELEALEAEGAVRRIGYVPDEDLPALYNLARVFVFPSFYEGFGLPVIEAMACGAPVITSDCSSLAEIGTGAARLVDPHDVEALAGALHELLSREDLRAALRAAGLARAAQFSWAHAAEETVRVYDAALA